jgi:hypothetical protein
MAQNISDWKVDEVNPLLTVRSKRLIDGKLTYIVIRQEIAFEPNIILEPSSLPKLIEILSSLCQENTESKTQ